MSDKVTFKRDTDEQAVTFHSLSDDDELAFHEIVDRVFRMMERRQAKSDIFWLMGKYDITVK